MFSKKTHLDVKKSSQKVLDFKKDSLSRLKHLKIVLESLDVTEAKIFFENNYSHIYYIFYDVFIHVENNLKRAHHRTQKEEFDLVKYILEKLLVLLPELLHKRWQCHSLERILKKFLHCGNSTKLRREGIRLFLIWYQILGDNAPEELDKVFASLVPGIVPGVPNPYITMQSTNQGHGFFNRGQNTSVDAYQETSTFYSSPVETVDTGPVNPSEILPICPISSTEHQPEDHTLYFLECLLEMMVSQIYRIEWKDKNEVKTQKCFQFLFEKFKKYYLNHLFPDFCDSTTLYKPVLEIPKMRYEGDIKLIHDNTRFVQKETLQHCQAVFVRWVTHFTQCLKKNSVTFQQQAANENVEQTDTNRPSTTDADPNHSGPNFLMTAPVGLDRDPSNTSLSNDELSYRDYLIVRDTLYSSRKNINFVHEVFRQAFLMPFTCSSTMRKVVAVYREWIQKNSSEKPVFLEEPPVKAILDYAGDRIIEEGKVSYANSFADHSEPDDLATPDPFYTRLRKDSYLKAIHADYSHLKAGLQNMLNVFITNASNVFLLNLSTDNLQLLEEQVDMCKRVLNIYRYMVMNAQMDRRVWEQLLLVLLQITSLVLKEVPPTKKENTLGGRLAPALFQTLIVTWIKANLNVVISAELWDQFLHVLSSLTQWEELIKEWAKTMETLTRVLAKQVYSLDLNDLPLERMSEQKMKKTRGIKKLSMGILDERNNLKSTHKNVRSTFHSSNDYDDTSSQDTETDRTYTHQSMRSRSGSGCSQKRYAHSEFFVLRKSASDSSLYKRTRNSRTRKELVSAASGHKQALIVTGASPNTDEDPSHAVSSLDDENDIHFRNNSKQKSRSLDILSHRAESPCFSESSECHSRSPSPTPSSGLESTSIKDSPMQIDVLVSSSDNPSSNVETNNASNTEARSVMSGGNTRGWLPDVAVVLWKRMLGALGNINHITDPNIHAQVLKYLVDLSELLIKIRNNIGVTVDNMSSPAPPELVPPFLIINPWLFEALNLSDKYKEGKLLAYKLLCHLTLSHHDVPLSCTYLVQFYRVIHFGLMCEDPDVINIIVKSCSKFFGLNLPGCTLLLMDFIYAIDIIVSSNGLKGVPRTEAVTILGALLCLPNAYKKVLTLKTSTELSIISSKDAKDHITSILFKAGKREPAGLARCIAISSIGIYLYEELKSATNHFRIKEAIAVLLIAVRFNCKAVAQVATDMLLLLCDHSQYLLDNHTDLVRKIIEDLTASLGNLLPNPDIPVGEPDKQLILSLIHCLGEWCLALSQCFLTEVWSPLLSNESYSPLFSVFKVLHAAASGSGGNGCFVARSMTDLIAGDVDPTILVDNFNESYSPTIHTVKSDENADKSQDNSFFKPAVDSQHNHDVIKLAAKNVLYHLVNHLGHFPMGIGAVRLTSLVNEYDDVPSLNGDELSTEVFHAPNIQFFVVNNSSVVSFVEIPSLDLPGGGATAGLMASKSQVRAIVRDLSGKFSWDCSILYGPPDYAGETLFKQIRHVPLFRVLPQQVTSNLNQSVVENNSVDTVLRHRSADILPTVDNSAEDFDNLDDLLQYIGYISPECISCPGQALNSAPTISNEHDRGKETDTRELILNQHDLELNEFNKHCQSNSMEVKSVYPPEPCEDSYPFQHCRLLLNQLGFTLWEKRSSCDLLKKNEQLLRELRNLDKQKCRETHKIAVIYVAKGQEDKTSILSNSGGSQEFEDFVSGLGWEVELENHLGFLGGLQKNGSTGETAPYFATSFIEVIFHVSTRMNLTQDKDAINKKIRHLGNDEVHIVWSEHSRDYRKEIIATEFCDVLIVIYPIGGRLYRIHISKKSGIPFFGPLFSGAIVEHKVLASLVRATAINANRVKRSLVSLYMDFYEERAKSLETIVQNHKDKTTFEQFAANIYSPAPSKSHPPSLSSGPPSRTDSACSRGIPNLAAALLDAHSRGSSSYSPHLRNRPISQSTSEGLSPHSSPQTSIRDRPLSASHSQA